MIYQFLGDASGAASSAGGSTCSAAASAASCTSFCPVEASGLPSASPATANLASSGCSSKYSFSSSISRLFCEVLQDRFDALRQNRIDHRKICGEGEHAEDHDSCGALHLLAVRPGHAAHLQLQIVEIILRVPNPNFDIGSSHKVFLATYSQLVAGCLAGAEGFEPPLAVLETAGLPLNLRPCVAPPVQGGTLILLDFLVRLVLPAVPAELLHFQAFGGGLLVLGRRVVPVLALRALERNDVARHGSNSYLMISVTVPAPTVRPPSRIAKRKPLSMATGGINSTGNPTLPPARPSSNSFLNISTPVTTVLRVSRKPTISISSPTLQIPRSMRPVTTVPRP